MKKMSLIMLFLLMGIGLSGCGSKEVEEVATEPIDNIAEEDTNSTKEEGTNSANASGNLITVTEEEFIENTNDDNLVGNDGDQQYTGSQGREQFGFNPTITVTDTDGDGQIAIGETMHVVVGFENTSDIDYTVSSLSIQGTPLYMEEDNFTNITSTNIEPDNEEYGFEYEGRNNFIKSGIANFVVAAGETSSIEFDAKLDSYYNLGSDKYNTPEFAVNSEDSKAFFNVQFFIDTPEMNDVSYTLSEENLSIQPVEETNV